MAAAPHPHRISSRTRACRQSSLRARYVGGGFGGQADFGDIVVWNVGSRACRLAGRSALAASLADGRPDRQVHSAVGDRLITVVLPARAPTPVRTGLDSGQYLVALLMVPETTARGHCGDAGYAGRMISPRTVRLTIGDDALVVVNRDRTDRAHRSIQACQGELWLETVRLQT